MVMTGGGLGSRGIPRRGARILDLISGINWSSYLEKVEAK